MTFSKPKSQNIMLSRNDLNLIQQRGITEQQVEHQLEQI